MKIAKWVTVEQEIEVDVSAEDIANAIAEDLDRVHTCMVGVNNFAKFAKSIPDRVIAEMTDGNRKVIGEFLREQADRFLSNDKLSHAAGDRDVASGKNE